MALDREREADRTGEEDGHTERHIGRDIAAARAAARAASLGEAYGYTCRAAISDWLADGTSCEGYPGGEEVTVTATVDIPSIVPGWNFDPVRKSATMPRDH